MVYFYFHYNTEVCSLLPSAALNLFESCWNNNSPTAYLPLLNWLHTSVQNMIQTHL